MSTPVPSSNDNKSPSLKRPADAAEEPAAKRNPAPKPYCIYIDPTHGTVSREDMPLGYKAINAMLGQSPFGIGMALQNGDIIYVDDEAEYRDELAPKFEIEGCRFRGKAVMVSIGPKSGNDCNPKSTVEAITAAVSFPVELAEDPVVPRAAFEAFDCFRRYGGGECTHGRQARDRHREANVPYHP